MLWIYADRYDNYSGEPRRTTFKASLFTCSIAQDGRSGTLKLHPDPVILRVGSSLGDYHCVRVFGDSCVIGTMRRSAAGEVFWQSATDPSKSE